MRLIVVGALIFVGCSSGATAPNACDIVADEHVAAVIGSVQAHPYSIDRFSECRWVGDGREVVLTIEVATDPVLYVAHSIEGSDPGSVSTLDIGDEAVLFANEALLARQGSHIVTVTSRTEAVGQLEPLLSAAVAWLASE